MSKKNPETYLALPGGEWMNSLKNSLINAGIDVTQKSKRAYRVELPKYNIQGVIVRASDIPKYVDKKKSRFIAGITGTDILVESGRKKISDTLYGLPIPVDILDKENSPKPSIYIGYTPNAVETFGEQPTLEQVWEGVHRHFVS